VEASVVVFEYEPPTSIPALSKILKLAFALALSRTCERPDDR
jgi:hypothetical protein